MVLTELSRSYSQTVAGLESSLRLLHTMVDTGYQLTLV